MFAPTASAFSPAPDTDLNDAQGFVRVVLVKVVDVSWQGDAEEVVSLPQAAQLQVTHFRTHFEGGDRRSCADVPQFYSLVARGGDQLGAVWAPADLESLDLCSNKPKQSRKEEQIVTKTVLSKIIFYTIKLFLKKECWLTA